MDGIITQRLVEMTFAPLDEVAGWLTRLGMETDQREEGVVRIHNPHLGITTAITAISDPVSRAVCLGFAVAGVWWPHVFPNLLTGVNKAWRSRRKQAASNASPVGPSPGKENSQSRPARKPPPVTVPTFTDLYKNQNPGK
jgi:hypothetical protein